MKTAIRQSELQLLGQSLQQELQANAPQHLPVEVRCTLKQDWLIVLAQHPLDITPDPEQVFAVLEQALQTLQPEIRTWAGTGDTFSVRLYLRVVGHKQPYTFKELDLTTSTIAPIPQSTPDHSGLEEIEPEMQEDGAIAPLPVPILPESQKTATIQESSLVQDVPSRFAHFSLLASIPLPVLALSTLLGVVSLVGGWYLLTRPCVLGQCEPLNAAQRLSQQSIQMTQSNASANNVIEAYQQLVEASYLLSTIPSWSPYYKASQTLLKTYETQAEILGQMVTALQHGHMAAEKSQHPPHPLATWREVQQLWQDAIALLTAIPQDSSLYPLAQQKLQQYQANLVGIDQRLRAEQQSQEKVNSARSVADAAITRETMAQSVEAWEVVHSTWEVVINALEQVPQGSMAYAEAQQLLAIYQPRLAGARDRYKQEEISANAYNEALRLAEQAQQAEQRNQWSQAVDQWQDALETVSQVPNGTSFHNQAQPLLANYRTALSTAQESLRTAVVRQTAESELKATCTGASPICTYTIDSNVIQVNFTSDYDWAVQAVIANTPLTGDLNTQVAMRDYVNSLLRAIATTSQTAQMPIDLYNSEGTVFGTYDPQLDGFVQRQ